MKIQLDGLTARELGTLIGAAEKRIEVLGSRRPAAVVRRELSALAANHGYALNELFDASDAAVEPRKKRAKRKVAKVAPKYRDPDNKRNTWSGRGRTPRWLAEKVKRGQSQADFLIPGLAKPTQNSRGVGQRSVFKAG